MNDTPDGVRWAQAIAISRALVFYANTGMRANRAYTPKAMMAAASRITGRTFKPRQYREAAAALTEWAMKDAR